VELLSVVYDDGAPGLVNTAIHERGKTVVALAWPQRSHQVGDEVLVERLRGALSGDGYSGEWFLTDNSVDTPASPVLYYGSWGDGRNEIDALTDQMPFTGSLAKKLWFSGESSANSLFTGAAPNAPRGSALLTCLTAGRYMFWVRTVWHLHTISPEAFEEWALSYWTAPSTTVYPVFSLHGAFYASAFTRFNSPGGADPLGFPDGGRSSLVVRSNGSGATSYNQATHYGHYFRELDVGDEIHLSMDWTIDTPLDRTVTTYPQAELDEVSLAAIYCGSAGNV
jgi:hypothetical protein